MVLGELDCYMQKMKIDHQLTPYTRINSKWTKDLNISCDTIKVQVENIGSKISDIPHSNIFADISPRARGIEGKKTPKQMGLHQIKSFCMAKETISKMKREITI